MGWVIALLLIAVAAYFIIRTGATALEMTGISRDAARFQALSAFFGAGFTTSESELVVNHPVRRRVIRDLIVVGNIGVLSIIASAVASIVNASSQEIAGRFAIIAGALILLFLSGRFVFVTRPIDRLVAYTLRRAGVLRVLDYEKLLGVRRGYSVSEVSISDESWLDGKTLAEAKLRDEGLTVLAVISPAGDYQGAPRGGTRLRAGQTLVVYGKDESIQRLTRRQSGEAGRQDHEEAIREFRESHPEADPNPTPGRD